jgi:hypothetical protein
MIDAFAAMTLCVPKSELWYNPWFETVAISDSDRPLAEPVTNTAKNYGAGGGNRTHTPCGTGF